MRGGLLNMINNNERYVKEVYVHYTNFGLYLLSSTQCAMDIDLYHCIKDNAKDIHYKHFQCCQFIFASDKSLP